MLTDEDIDAYRQKLVSASTLAKRHDAAISTVLVELRRAGIPINKQGTTCADTPKTRVSAINSSRNSEIRELRATGLKMATIGKRFNITRQRVSQILKEQS